VLRLEQTKMKKAPKTRNKRLLPLNSSKSNRKI